MSRHDEVGRDPFDIYLGGCMKDFVMQHPLPPSGKTELLEAASTFPLNTRSGGLFGLVFLVLRRSLRALSYLFSGQPELDPLPGKMAMVFVSGVSLT
ncbi:MAG: hypothetical protein AMJ88_15465 [Anaerolineae bacterium SM23_ 63]|nr:MAG: hypothetical protein AMJ88_15465 [Anaerolineae bacterium SM23_ 63]HEY47003.1 hypothetical protein [Anaerolineae bacterium]